MSQNQYHDEWVPTELEPADAPNHWDVRGGASINVAVSEAFIAALQTETNQFFAFNGIEVEVAPDSRPPILVRDYMRASRGYIEKVGPYGNKELTEEEQANDARIKAINDAERAAQQAKWNEEKRLQQERVDALLKDAPAIELKDAERWAKQVEINSHDAYSKAVVDYAERWARMMQVEIASGKTLEDVAETTSHEADTDGITGFMYGAALNTLYHCWVHGEELVNWNEHRFDEGLEALLDEEYGESQKEDEE